MPNGIVHFLLFGDLWVCECENRMYSHTYCFGTDAYIGRTTCFLSHSINTD